MRSNSRTFSEEIPSACKAEFIATRTGRDATSYSGINVAIEILQSSLSF